MREQALAGARVIVNLNASPFHAGKTRERERMIATRASDNGVAVAYVNQVGGQDELVFDGNSLVLGPSGELIARGASMERGPGAGRHPRHAGNPDPAPRSSTAPPPRPGR